MMLINSYRYASGGGGPTPPLFSVIPATGLTYAYSLRNLGVSGYAGNAIRVRRSSDNAEQDIGFVGNDLDTASLLTFCGAGSGFVKTWYDQKGTSNWTQTTAAAQPRIVNAGVLDVLTGARVGMTFDGVNDIFIGAANTISSPMTRCTVLKFISVASGQNVSSDGTANSLYFPSSGSLATYSGVAGVVFKSGIVANDIAAVTERPNTDAVYNGAATATLTGTAGSLRQNLGGSSTGGGGSAFANIMACEYLMFAAQMTSGDVVLCQANQKAYWGTP